MNCEKCGKQLIDGSKFCDGCGAKVTGQDAAPVAATSESYSPLPGTPPFSAPPPPSTPTYSVPPQPSSAAYSAPLQPSNPQYSAPPSINTPPYTAPPQPQPSFNWQQQYSNSPYQPNKGQAQTDAQPMTVGQYIVMFLLLSIPIANIVFLFKWGFGSGVNANKKNCARAMLIFFVIFIVLWIVAGTAMSGLIMKLSRGF